MFCNQCEETAKGTGCTIKGVCGKDEEISAIAWYKQKAVLVLLALLSPGVKDITLGPKLPAFVSPAVLDVLVKNFDLKPNTTVDSDMARMVPAGNCDWVICTLTREILTENEELPQRKDFIRINTDIDFCIEQIIKELQDHGRISKIGPVCVSRMPLHL